MTTKSSSRSKTSERSLQSPGRNQSGPSKSAQSKGGQHSHGGKGKR